MGHEVRFLTWDFRTAVPYLLKSACHCFRAPESGSGSANSIPMCT
jgi:hypothetical protein